MTRSVAAPPPPVAHADLDRPDPVPTIAIVGDSTTAWEYSVGGDPTLSWTTTALQSVQIVCGWAESGATVAVMLYPSRVLEWNAAIAAHAQARGWIDVDPWAPARDPSGAFVPGTAVWDNVHPTPETAVMVGTELARALTLANKYLP